MRIGQGALALALVALLGGCSSPSKEVKRIIDSPMVVDAQLNPEATFDAYGTWGWMPGPRETAVDPRVKDPRVRTHVEDAVKGEMFKRGYGRPTDSSPDLLVSYHLAVQEIDEKYLDEVYGGVLPEYRTEFKGSKKHRDWVEGTLLLLVFDTGTRQLVWQASVSAEVTDLTTPKEREDRVMKAVRLLMEEFPRKSS